MTVVNVINLLGGLGLFLFGMKYMSEGLNQVAGSKMKNLLEKLTRNRFKGFLLGVLVTAVIQSSSATTVMLMGFLNAGIMDLAQATGVIIGANIGTTVTAVLIAIDVSAIAPACIITGALLALFGKKQKLRYIGQIILGFGILFFGLKYMSGADAMGVLKSDKGFQSLITSVNNPFVGILIGFLVCSVLQSSSAAIGVLQMLALSGGVPIKLAIFLIIGINIGSATPLVLSAIGAKTNAKRAAFVYFIFNFILVFLTPLAYVTPFLNWVEDFSGGNGSVEVATCHILFKIISALVLLPFVPQIVKLSEMVFKPKEHESAMRFQFIDKKITENTTATVLQIGSEVERMAKLVRTNFVLACEGYLKGSLADEQKIRDTEELINWLNHNISDFMVTVCSQRIDAESSEYIGKLFHVITDLERIGDHAENILNRTKTISDGNMDFSEESRNEVQELYEKVLELLDRSIGCFVNKEFNDFEEHELHDLENTIDDLTLQAQDAHVQRLKEKKCHTSSGVVYTKLLQDLERVGDHAYNIAWAARKDKNLIRQI
ncbi:MAG: Na/Pi cotransporter family protein [Ruminococcaceae bacterium]|nr:Na/Pi cotransporter family protein [Oscillospiraceae bacterium]